MASPENVENVPDEPLTPSGRLFLRPEMNQIIHCAIGLQNPINLESLKSQIQNSLMIRHPRFCSLMVRDRHGREHWRRTQIDLDRHLIIHSNPISDAAAVNDEDVVNDYLAELSTSSAGLGLDKPLWEIHVLEAHKCLVFRIHHALGDGVSLMSMLMACCRRAGDENELPSIGGGGGRKREEGRRRMGRLGVLLGFLGMVWWSLVFVVGFVLRTLWVCDRKTSVSGGAGVELWPRKMATARFWLEDMKAVKRAVANATINDVLFGVISSGLSRYLDHRSPNALNDGIQLTGVAMVNLREQPGLHELSKLMGSDSGTRWGNKFGMALLPVYYHKSGSDQLEYLKRAKVMIDRKKKSIEAHFSYRVGDFIMSYLGPKFASLLNYRIVCNTTFTISNVLGPQEEITVTGDPVTYIRATSSSLPHAITMHMVSYAGRADMQILVAKDIVPDPEFLAKCFEEALLQMKEAAAAVTTTKM